MRGAVLQRNLLAVTLTGDLSQSDLLPAQSVLDHVSGRTTNIINKLTKFRAIGHHHSPSGTKKIERSSYITSRSSRALREQSWTLSVGGWYQIFTETVFMRQE